jgi:dihydrofolate reductase
VGRTIAQMSMSLDGFIADEQDDCSELFGHYDSGNVPVENPSAGITMHMSDTDARLYQDALASTGAYLMGRRLYDLVNGWNGHPPSPDPVVVLTHGPPPDPPTGGVEYAFADTIEEAVGTARRLAGDGNVSVAGGQVARAALDAGLLDEIVVDLIPVILGAGKPWFAGADGPVRLDDPEVTVDAGVTHLRYVVRR